jgi:hypothetical protein
LLWLLAVRRKKLLHLHPLPWLLPLLLLLPPWLRLLPPLLLAPLLPPLALLTLPRVLHPLWPVLLTLPRALLTLPRARWALPKRQSRNNRFSGLEKATFGWLFFVSELSIGRALVKRTLPCPVAGKGGLN